MDLFDTVSLAGSLVLAIPIALLGLEFLLVDGQVARGVAFLAVAAALVLGQHYLGAEDIAKRLAGSALERYVGDERDDTDGGGDDVGTGTVGGAGHGAVDGPAGADRAAASDAGEGEPLIPDAETGEPVDGGDGTADGGDPDEEAYKP